MNSMSSKIFLSCLYLTWHSMADIFYVCTDAEAKFGGTWTLSNNCYLIVDDKLSICFLTASIHKGIKESFLVTFSLVNAKTMISQQVMQILRLLFRQLVQKLRKWGPHKCPSLQPNILPFFSLFSFPKLPIQSTGKKSMLFVAWFLCLISRCLRSVDDFMVWLDITSQQQILWLLLSCEPVHVEPIDIPCDNGSTF